MPTMPGWAKTLSDVPELDARLNANVHFQFAFSERSDDIADVFRRHGIGVRVFTNQGPKGPAIKAIIEEYQPSHTIFIDDLAQHHNSAAEIAPDIIRLHLCGEPLLAPHIACAASDGLQQRVSDPKDIMCVAAMKERA